MTNVFATSERGDKNSESSLHLMMYIPDDNRG